MGGRIMAHNGGFGELTSLEAELGEYRGLVHGDTDSERFFALITQQIDAHAGDVAAGITAAARWIAATLPVTSLNAVVVAPGELWALRYPGQHALHVLATSVHGPDLDVAPTVVVASEEMDGVAGWRMLDVGELIHVGPDLPVTSTIVLPEPPVRLVPLPGRNPNIDT
jgi:predicted glutamine amidotransferase